MIGWIILGVISIAVLIYFFFGFRQIQQQERAIVELFGKFSRTLKPGLNWIWPGIMKIRAVVSTWELSLPIFESGPKIDFRDGSAVPKNAEVFVQMRSPDMPYSVDAEEPKSGAYRAIYEISNWRASIRDLVENALRTFLNRLSIDEAITMQKAGFDLVNHDPNLGLPNEELEKIEKALATWGWSLRRITVGDFDLDPEIVQARGQVHLRQREAEASEYVRVQRARETMGTLVQMLAESTGKTFAEIQKEIDDIPEAKEELKKFAEELVTRRMSLDGKALTDIRVAGGDELSKGVMAIIAAIKKA